MALYETRLDLVGGLVVRVVVLEEGVEVGGDGREVFVQRGVSHGSAGEDVDVLEEVVEYLGVVLVLF